MKICRFHKSISSGLSLGIVDAYVCIKFYECRAALQLMSSVNFHILCRLFYIPHFTIYVCTMHNAHGWHGIFVVHVELESVGAYGPRMR